MNSNTGSVLALFLLAVGVICLAASAHGVATVLIVAAPVVWWALR